MLEIVEINKLIFFLLILIILIIIITKIYTIKTINNNRNNNNRNNNNRNNNNNSDNNTNNEDTYEGFNDLNYQDVKTKTINWCNKMQENGLLSPDQFNKCVSTFTDPDNSLLSKTMKQPQTGMERNYSIYNSKKQVLTSNITEDNTLNIYLSTLDGLTMGCKTDGTLYFVRNINDSNINQKELTFTLIPQSDNIFSLVSNNGKYLIANQNYEATFTANTIGPMTSWKFTKIDSNNNSSNDKIMISSTYFKEFNLIYDDTIKNIKIIYGSSDNGIWNMIPIKNNTTSGSVNQNTLLGEEFIITKENILNQLIQEQTNIIILESSIKTLQSLIENITNNYRDIIKHVQELLTESRRVYQLSSIDYQTRLDSINSNSMLSNDAKNKLITSLPYISGFNISTETITIIIANINNAKNIKIKNIQKQITELQVKLNNLKKNNKSNNDYNDFVNELEREINETGNRINQNNIIMERQKNSYSILNNKLADNKNDITEIKNVDNVSKNNIDIISNYNEQNELLMKIYPGVILIMVLLLFYLIYITYKKFINNIYNKY
jgi:hypothetical protein